MAASFNAVFTQHGYPPPFSSERDGTEIARWYQESEPEGSFVVALRDQVVAAGYLHIRGDRASIGPIAVHVKFQGLGLGRRLMQHLLDEAGRCSSVRLFQDAFNSDSFALYAGLGFRAAEVVPIVLAPAEQTPANTDTHIRKVGAAALKRVSGLDRHLTGAARERDLEYLLRVGSGFLLEEAGEMQGFLVAYSSRGAVYVGPAAAGTGRQLHRLIAAARHDNPGMNLVFRLPGRNQELLEELLREGCRLSNLGTLMVRGQWSPAAAAELLAVFPESL